MKGEKGPQIGMLRNLKLCHFNLFFFFAFVKETN